MVIATTLSNLFFQRHTAILLVDGTILISGGWNSSNVALSQSELFNFSSNATTIVAMLSGHAAHATVALLPDGTALIAGGINSFSSLSSLAEIYHPSINVTGNSLSHLLVFLFETWKEPLLCFPQVSRQLVE